MDRIKRLDPKPLIGRSPTPVNGRCDSAGEWEPSVGIEPLAHPDLGTPSSARLMPEHERQGRSRT